MAAPQAQQGQATTTPGGISWRAICVPVVALRAACVPVVTLRGVSVEQ